MVLTWGQYENMTKEELVQELTDITEFTISLLKITSFTHCSLALHNSIPLFMA